MVCSTAFLRAINSKLLVAVCIEDCLIAPYSTRVLAIKDNKLVIAVPVTVS